MVFTLHTQKAANHLPHIIAGSFGMGTTNVYATYTLAIAATDDMVLTSDTAGTAGNALDFQATADGTAKATLDLSSVMASLGTARAATGGTGGNDWSIQIIPGSGGGEGVNINEDTVNKVLTVMYEDTVSTSGDIMTAIDSATNFEKVGNGDATATNGEVLQTTSLAGGTAATWAEESGTPSKTHLHFTDGVTTGTAAMAAINGAYATGSKTMTASGAGAGLLAAGDAVAKQDLSGGVDAAGITNERGAGYTVAKTGTGQYTVTLLHPKASMYDIRATLQLATAADQFVLVGAYDSSAKTVVFTIWDKSAGAAANVAVNDNNRINFIATAGDY